MEVGDDRFIAAVAHYGEGKRVVTRVGDTVFTVRWVEGRSLGALRRLCGVDIGRSGAESFEDVKRAIDAAMKIPPAEILECVLRTTPHCFAVQRPGAPASEPPCGMVVGARRWAFDAQCVGAVGRFADVIDVHPRDRVAWCVEAAHGNITPAPRRDFHNRMMALVASGTSVAPARPESQLPDAGAWYRPALGAAIAIRAQQSECVVMFGAVLENSTMHVQVEERAPFVAGAAVGSVVAPAIAKFISTIRLPSRACVRNWVPSVLGAQLERVHITRTLEKLLPAGGDPRTMAISLSDAADLFRDSAAAEQAQRWLLATHEDRARDATADREWMAPHRVRLALECAGGASALWSLSMPLGAAYAGPTQTDSAHVLTFPRSPPLVVRPCGGGGWTASPRVSLGARDVTPLNRVRSSPSTLEAALRGLGDMGLPEFWQRVLASPSSETRVSIARLDNSQARL